MIRLGKAYGNLMVDLRATNEKLRDRSERLLMLTCGVTRDEAHKLLAKADESVKVAIVMKKLGLDRKDAETRLAEQKGVIRRVIKDPPPPVEGA